MYDKVTLEKCRDIAEAHTLVIGDLSYGRAAKDIAAAIERLIEANP